MKKMYLKDLVHEELHYEYKKAIGGFPKIFGKLIPHSLIVMADLFI